MKITIHTPSAGIRAVTVDGKVGQYEIRTEMFGSKKIYRLVDVHHQFGLDLGTSTSVRAMEFVLRLHLKSI